MRRCKWGVLMILVVFNFYHSYCQVNLPDGFCCYKEIQVNKTTSGTAFRDQVEIQITYEPEMNRNFSDIRFQSSSGSELSYWVENFTEGVSAKVWVNFGSTGTGTTTIYLYYGNPTAATQSNIDNVMTQGRLELDYYTYNENNWRNESRWNKRYSGADSVVVDEFYEPTTERIINYYFGSDAINLHGQSYTDRVVLRWKGWLKMPSTSGTVSFKLGSDDGVRLYLNNQLEIDEWRVRGYSSNTLNNYRYTSNAIPFQLDYFEFISEAEVNLQWNKEGRFRLIDRADYRCTSIYPTPPTASIGTAVNSTFSANASNLWLKADAGTGTTTDNTNVTSWQDQAGTNNASSSSGKYPSFQSNEANFNPSLQFDGTNDQMTINKPVQDDFTFALVVKPDAAGSVGTSWTQGSGIFDGNIDGSTNDFGGISLLASNVAFGTAGDHTLNSTNPIFNNNIPHLVIATRSASTGTKALFIDGTTDNTQTGATGSLNSPSQFRIGSLYSNRNYYDGHIFEILTFNNALSQSAREKLESYLALKYGLTLPKNYILDDGLVYDVTGYGNDIAGIGRNTENGLNQNISSSINTTETSSSNIIISTSNDFISDNQNTARMSLTDGQYLVWGHNAGTTNVWEDAGSYRKINRVWKTQNTGNVGEVNLQINLNGYPIPTGYYHIIVDNDNDISNGIVNAYRLENSSGDLYSTTITFPAGTNYFTIGHHATGQNVFWLKADAGTSTTTDNAVLSTWSDQSGSDNNISQTITSNQARYKESGANFNPMILFDGLNDFYNLSSTDGLGYGATKRTTFIVARDKGSSTRTWAWAFAYGKSNPNKAWALGRNNPSTKRVSVSGYGVDITTNNMGNNFRLIGGNYNGTEMELFLDGISLQTIPATLNTTVDRAHVGRQINNYAEYWGGEIAEVIHYSGEISVAKKQEINSYLAIKYGLSLGHNYQIGSTILYTRDTYNNDIAGIGRNDTFGLNQLVSSSQNNLASASSNVTISRSNDFTSNNFSSRPPLDNEEYLIWGHNAGSTNDWTNDGNFKRVNRFWKVQNTGDVGLVNFEINLTGYPAPYANYYLIVDDDANLSNGITQTYELTNNSGTLYNCSLTFSNETSYFTIGHSSDPIVSFWVKADAGTNTTTDNANLSSWASQASTAASADQATTSNQATYQANELNYNPTILFDGDNDYYDISPMSHLGYGSIPRNTFVVARENSTTNDTWSFVFAYGSPGNRNAWAIGKRFTSSKRIVIGTYITDLIKSTWGNSYKLVTAQYNGLDLAMYTEGQAYSPLTTTPNTLTSVARLGRQINNYNEFWGGEIAEVMHWLGEMNDTKRNEVETYLAIKYGLTLSNDYIIGSNTIYDISSYYNDIFGLANNSDYNLDQRVSTSTNVPTSSPASVIFSVNSDFTTSNNSNTRTALSNGQYLIAGSNNASIATWVPQGNYKRVYRTWKVQNTGDVGAINIQVNFSNFPATTDDYYLVIDSDNDLSNGIINSQPLSNSSGNLYTGEVTFPAGKSYFTFCTASNIDIQLSSYANISTNGGNDGALTALATGGVGNYSYSWSSGQTTAEISNLSSGEYTVTVTSGSSTAQRTFYLYNPDQITLSSTVVSSPSCPGDSNGEISLTTSFPDEKCINFDGVNNYIALNDSKSGINAFSELTVCAWIKVNTGQGGWSILDYDQSEYFNVSIGDNTGGDNKVHFDTHSQVSNNIHNFNGNVNVADGTWHHIACVYDGRYKYIYVDGVLDSSTASAPHNGQDIGSNITRFGFIGEGSEALIQNGARNNLYFQGKIAVVELWERALGTQEVAARMNSTETATGLVGQWKLEEGTGTSISATIGGNGNLYGTTRWETDSFYSISSYNWTKVGDTSYSESTRHIRGLYGGTYNYNVQVENGYSISGSETIDSGHQNISTNPIQFE